MPLSRRQFFSQFWNSADRPPSRERLARYQMLETYARTKLFPYDFALTKEQEEKLMAEVRNVIQAATDQELFSMIIRTRIEHVVDATITPWRDSSLVLAQAERLRELREAAPGYVGAYLKVQASPTALQQLKESYATENLDDLEKALQDQIRMWVADLNDRLLLQYDILTVKDLVFAQLRSWC